MSSIRTQIYLTEEQRRLLDARAAREHKTMAQVVREAVDAYVTQGDAARVNAASSSTYGSLADLEPVSRVEWDRGPEHRL